MLFGNLPRHGSRHIGCIDPLCDPRTVVQDAYENARFLCDQYYLSSPNLEIIENNELNKSEPIRIVYVPSHLYHILFELFKNSMRAVMEHHGHENTEDVPPVKVTIVCGKEDICVKVYTRGFYNLIMTRF